MSKWRPADKNCIYVIGDIHGKYSQLKLILNRILPLRKTDGGKDKLIFLGDYVDRHVDSHKVLDELIKLKKKYKDQVVFLKGNHELMMLEGLETSATSEKYLFWMRNGGEETLSGYINRNSFEDELDEDYRLDKNRYVKNPYLFPRFRAADMVPKEHIEFLKECQLYYELDNYVFAHAGWNPGLKGKDQDEKMLLWDNWDCALLNTIKTYVRANIVLPWKETIVTGHYWKGPVIYDKYLMLDVSGYGNLIIMELHSRQGFIAQPKKNRLVAFNDGNYFLSEFFQQKM